MGHLPVEAEGHQAWLSKTEECLGAGLETSLHKVLTGCCSFKYRGGLLQLPDF